MDAQKDRAKPKKPRRVKVVQSDALNGVRGLEDQSVQVCATSPPYYLQRSYGATTTWPDGWVGELGHEVHPNEFIRHLLNVFDQVWRVLKDDGCLWVNLGDTYNNKQGKKGTTHAPNGSNGRFDRGGKKYADALRAQPEFFKHFVDGIPHKSEMGIPARFHLAMTDAAYRVAIGAPSGAQWICRRTIIWAKSVVSVTGQQARGNAMPEPTRDRPSRNYEFIFLFSKRPDYYFDRRLIDVPARSSYKEGDRTNGGSVWETDSTHCCEEVDGLWEINSEPSPYRHVAMWPRALVKQMLLPSTRENDVVLDPFAGSGTTGQVALEMGRRAVLVESSEQCLKAIADRIKRAKSFGKKPEACPTCGQPVYRAARRNGTGAI